MAILQRFVILFTVFISCRLISLVNADTPYKELYFEQNVDHFNPYSKIYGKQTFMQRYLVQGERDLITF